MKKPYVSKQGTQIIDAKSRLLDFIYSFDEIKISDITAFARENYLQIVNIMEFIDALNNDFFFKNSKTIIREKCLKTKPSEMKELISIIYREIEQSGTMPIRDLDCFYKLHIPDVKTNEWLIYSIINKYSDELDVGATSKN